MKGVCKKGVSYYELRMVIGGPHTLATNLSSMEDKEGLLAIIHHRETFMVLSTSLEEYTSLRQATDTTNAEAAAFVPKYQKMLHATTVSSVEDAAKIIGIDLTKPDFWRSSLELMTKNIELFLELTI